VSPKFSKYPLDCSTCSVAVLPELSEDSNFKIPDSDLKFEYMRSSGAGGQNVNVTDTAVRVLHLPTGLAIKSQVQYFGSTFFLKILN